MKNGFLDYFFHPTESLVNSRVAAFWVEKMKKNTVYYIGVFLFLFFSIL